MQNPLKHTHWVKTSTNVCVLVGVCLILDPTLFNIYVMSKHISVQTVFEYCHISKTRSRALRLYAFNGFSGVTCVTLWPHICTCYAHVTTHFKLKAVHFNNVLLKILIILLLCGAAYPEQFAIIHRQSVTYPGSGTQDRERERERTAHGYRIIGIEFM